MKLLLDTRVTLWWLTASPRLAKSPRELMASSPCSVSVANVWEVDLKHRLGKLPIAPVRFRYEMRSAGSHYPIGNRRTRLTRVKPAESHRDPFDRLLLSVAEAENLVLLTADAALIALAASGIDVPAHPLRKPGASTTRARSSGI